MTYALNPSMTYALDTINLSLPPVDYVGRGLVQTGKDVLRCRPNEYRSTTADALWTDGLSEADLAGATGRRGGTSLSRGGYEPYALNYAFQALYPHIRLWEYSSEDKAFWR